MIIPLICIHYSDLIMNGTASQITGVSIVCSTVCSGANQRKHQSSASLASVRETTGGFPSQMARNAERVSTDKVIITWHQHHRSGKDTCVVTNTLESCLVYEQWTFFFRNDSFQYNQWRKFRYYGDISVSVQFLHLYSYIDFCGFLFTTEIIIQNKKHC